jgi:hypothetical protein
MMAIQDGTLETFEVFGIELDVIYECEVEVDPYGTGDSPTTYEVTIHSVETTDSTINIEELLSKRVMDALEDEIIALEGSML